MASSPTSAATNNITTNADADADAVADAGPATYPPASTGRRLLSLLQPSSSSSGSSSSSSSGSVLSRGTMSTEDCAALLKYVTDYAGALNVENAEDGGRAAAAAGPSGDSGAANVGGDDGDDNSGGADGTSGAGSNGGNGANHEQFTELILATLRAAHRSTANHFDSRNAASSAAASFNGNGNDNIGGSGAIIDTPTAAELLLTSGPPPFTPRLARRILTDGLLALCTTVGPSSGRGGGGGRGGNNGGVEGRDGGSVVDDIVARCVVEILLPCCAVPKDCCTKNTGNVSNNAGSGGGSNSGNTIAPHPSSANLRHVLETSSDIGIETLLPTYLSRMVAVHNRMAEQNEQSGDGSNASASGGNSNGRNGDTNSNRSGNGNGSGGQRTTTTATTTTTMMDAPSVLDALCSTSDSSHTLRPHRAAAVASALGELEGIVPGTLLNLPSSSAAKSTSNDKKDDKDGKGSNKCNRVESLTNAMLAALHTLTSNARELDSLPPLVYQLCLLPSRVGGGRGNGGSGSGGGGGATTSTAAADRAMASSLIDLRVKILAGIADSFDMLREKVDIASNANASAAAASASGNGNGSRSGSRTVVDADAVRWAVGTSLSHVGTGLRGDPDLVKAVLKLVKGDVPTTTTTTIQARHQHQPTEGSSSSSSSSLSSSSPSMSAPFRYLRLTPFRLCLALTAASALPRTRAAALEAIRDLIVEEQIIGTKRTQSPWFNAVAGTMVLRSESNATTTAAGSGSASAELTEEQRVTKEFRDGSNMASIEGSVHCEEFGRHVFSCVESVVTFASSKDGIGAELTGLMQSLVTLGFLLVDCVKKDSATTFAPSFGSASGSTTNRLIHANKCPMQDLRHTGSTVVHKANESAADIGRRILSFLFVTAGRSANSNSTSSLSTTTNVSPLCRSILHTASDKFCGMAPNAVQHSFLLRDLALGSFEDLGKIASSAVTALATDTAPDILAASFIPTIINYLSNIPGGGMPPAVAVAAVVPALNAVLHHQCCRRRYRDVEDNVDHCFLLAKKAIFCTDAERRAVAVNILCMLIGIVVVSGNQPGSSAANFSMDSGGATLDEIRGYLRRCLTQHQPAVRMEVYASLIGLLPCIEDGNPDDCLTPSSPDPDGTPIPIARKGKANVGKAICEVVADILSSQLERYVSPEEDKEDKKARRDRAMKHGSQLSQAAIDSDDEDDDEGDDGSPSEPPIRLDLCLLEIRGTGEQEAPSESKKKGKGGKAKKPQGPTLLESARNKIGEPLCFLLASCSEAIHVRASSPLFGGTDSDSQIENDLHKTFSNLKRRVAKSKLSDYLECCEKKQSDFDDTPLSKTERSTNELATCVLVASVAETLMGDRGSNISGGDPGETTERLFKLRSDAVEKAALILATPQASKKKKAASTKKEGGSKKKKKKTNDGENDHPNTSGDGASSGKADIKQAALDKARRTIEDQINQMCPSLQKEFLQDSFRSFGVTFESSAQRSQLTYGEDQTAQTRLTASIKFRTFLLEKALRLLDGSGIIIKAGRRLDPTSNSWKYVDDDDIVALQNSNIATAMILGPLIFTEFASHCSKRDRTSLKQSARAMGEVPLTQLSLSVVVRCMQRVLDDHPAHQLHKEKRAFIFLRQVVAKVTGLLPDTKKPFNFYMKGGVSPPEDHPLSSDALALRNILLAFASPVLEFQEEGGPKTRQGGILSELLANSMDIEAAECVKIIACAASVIQDPDVRMSLGTFVLRCWEASQVDASWNGVLGLEHREYVKYDEDPPANKSPIVGVDAALILSGHLDGDTPIATIATKSGSVLPESRFAALLPTMASSDWPEAHRRSIDKHLIDDRGAVGVARKLSLALSVSLGLDSNFDGHQDLPSKKSCRISIVDTIAALPPQKGLFAPRELGTLASSIQEAIDSALTDADFVVLKMLPHLNDDDALDHTREFVAGRLLAASTLVSTLSGCAINCDDTATFVASLLRSAKRIYATYTKLVQLQLKGNPQKLDSPLSRRLLTEMSERMTPRTMCMLLTMQENSDAGENKYMTDKKIESQGKIAAAVVFEKERMDTFLTKACTKLKSLGLDDTRTWLEKQVVQSVNRDFRIKTNEIKMAQKREAPPEKKAGKKRKSEEGAEGKKKKAKKSKSKKKSADSDDEDDEDSDDESMLDVDASVADADASIVGEASIASMDEDESEGELTDTDEESE